MKDYFAYQGTTSMMGISLCSQGREAFDKGLIVDGEGWMEMIKNCNRTSHTYINTLWMRL